MRLLSFHDWIRRIYATRDDELSCDEVSEVMARYVDLVVAGESTSPRFADVEQHLKQCPHCYDLFLGLRDAALLENQQTSVEIELERCKTC